MAKAKRAAPRRHEIGISIQGGALQYESFVNGKDKGDGRSVHVRRRDTIKWKFDGACVCLFKRDGALDFRIFHGKGRTQKGTVKGIHVPGGDNKYRYFAAVIPAGSETVVYDDPDVIVDSDP